MAAEPVAYHLYKQRHFNGLATAEKAAKDGAPPPKRDFKNELLKIANAKIISKIRYKRIVENAEDRHTTLENRIINLPPREEESMRLRLEKSILGDAGAASLRRQLESGLDTRPSADSPTRGVPLKAQRGSVVSSQNSSSKANQGKSIFDKDDVDLDNPQDQELFRDRIIYRKAALDGTHKIFIYEDDGDRIQPERLVEIIIQLMDGDIQK